MSNRKLIDPSIVTGIADAIRNKKGTTATIQVSHLADEIASIQTMAQSTKDLVNAVSGVTPTDEISLNNGIASGVVDAPSVHSWADTRSTADGGTIKDGIAYVKALRGKSIKVAQLVNSCAALANVDGATTSWDDTTKEIVIENISRTTKYGSGSTRGIVRNVSGDLRAIVGHKYCAITDTTGVCVTCISSAGTYAPCIGVFTVSSINSGNPFFYLRLTNEYDFVTANPVGTTARAKLVLFDLTEMGCDNLTTPDQVAQYLGKASAADLLNTAATDGTILLNCKQKSVISKDADGQTLDTLTLPTLTAFPNGLCGVGTAYDEVRLAEGKATKRIGCVDLGTLNWVNSDVYGYTLQVPNHKRGGQFLWIKPKDAIFAAQFNTGNDGFVVQYPSGTYADNAALKADMSGVYLWYELATEEESTFTPCRAYYKASNNGQETATADTATAPFTAEIGYKEPTATELVTATSI